jgi:glutathione S-transferase
MITLYHLGTSRSERIIWLLEELRIPYELEAHAREPNGAAPPRFKALHAIGKAPILRDGETLLAESGAIVEYLVRRHGDGRLAPAPQSEDFPRYLYWMHFAEGSLMTLMIAALVLSRVPEAKDSPAKARLAQRMADMLAFVDRELEGRAWFAGGELTAADIMMVFPFTTMRRYLPYDLSPYANIAAFLQRVEKREPYRKAMALAGPDFTPP